jgi:hypothetical protein
MQGPPHPSCANPPQPSQLHDHTTSPTAPPCSSALRSRAVAMQCDSIGTTGWPTGQFLTWNDSRPPRAHSGSLCVWACVWVPVRAVYVSPVVRVGTRTCAAAGVPKGNMKKAGRPTHAKPHACVPAGEHTPTFPRSPCPRRCWWRWRGPRGSSGSCWIAVMIRTQHTMHMGRTDVSITHRRTSNLQQWGTQCQSTEEAVTLISCGAKGRLGEASCPRRIIVVKWTYLGSP